MKILIFTEGTIIMHKGALGHTREEIVEEVRAKKPSVHEYESYVPIGNACEKVKRWVHDGADIYYLTSRTKAEEIKHIENVLKKFQFPQGHLLFRKDNEEYKDVAERVKPSILIEDDCESIGGLDEMTITHVRPEIKKHIKSIVVKEFEGIDSLPDHVVEL